MQRAAREQFVFQRSVSLSMLAKGEDQRLQRTLSRVCFLHKLSQIKQACPAGQVSIVHVEDDPNPFALLELKDRNLLAPGEQYWVDVWSEPKIESSQHRLQDQQPEIIQFP